MSEEIRKESGRWENGSGELEGRCDLTLAHFHRRVVETRFEVALEDRESDCCFSRCVKCRRGVDLAVGVALELFPVSTYTASDADVPVFATHAQLEVAVPLDDDLLDRPHG